MEISSRVISSTIGHPSRVLVLSRNMPEYMRSAENYTDLFEM